MGREEGRQWVGALGCVLRTGKGPHTANHTSAMCLCLQTSRQGGLNEDDFGLRDGEGVRWGEIQMFCMGVGMGMEVELGGD